MRVASLLACLVLFGCDQLGDEAFEVRIVRNLPVSPHRVARVAAELGCNQCEEFYWAMPFEGDPEGFLSNPNQSVHIGFDAIVESYLAEFANDDASKLYYMLVAQLTPETSLELNEFTSTEEGSPRLAVLLRGEALVVGRKTLLPPDRLVLGFFDSRDKAETIVENFKTPPTFLPFDPEVHSQVQEAGTEFLQRLKSLERER